MTETYIEEMKEQTKKKRGIQKYIWEMMKMNIKQTQLQKIKLKWHKEAYKYKEGKIWRTNQ